MLGVNNVYRINVSIFGAWEKCEIWFASSRQKSSHFAQEPF